MPYMGEHRLYVLNNVNKLHKLDCHDDKWFEEAGRIYSPVYDLDIQTLLINSHPGTTREMDS